MRPERYSRESKQRFGPDRSAVTTTDRLPVARLLACCLLILAGPPAK